MNLAELLAADPAGPVTLTNRSGATANLNPLAGARLYAAVAEDRARMGLGLMDLPSAEVELEDAEDGIVVVRVAGALRYLVDDDELATGENALARLCTAPGCDGVSLGEQQLTRVCEDHLDVVVPGMLPAAGDDVLPGDRERAAADSRRMRLDAWEKEIGEREQTASGDRRVLETLRRG